jgi:hypothetical protein
MATKHPRVNITVDKELLGMLSMFAEREHMTLSSAAKDLICLGLEMQEDMYFSKLSEERLAKGGRNIPHKDAWK